MENMDCREFLGQAGVLMRQRKYDEALQYLDRAEQADQTNVDVYMAKGVCLASLQRYKEAEGQFETVLRLDRRNGLAQFHLGNIYMTTGFEAEGLDLYNRAIANGYGDSQIFFNLGLFYEEHDDEEMALRNYAKAYHANPGRADARVRRIYLQLRRGELTAALQAIEELIQACPDLFEGYHLRYLVLMQLGREDEAEQSVEQALQRFPQDVGLATDKVSLLIEKGQYDRALEYIVQIESGMEFGPGDRQNLALQKARIAAEMQDLDKTIAALEEARACAEEDPVLAMNHKSLFLLASCYMSKKEYPKAQICVQEILDSKAKSEYTAAAIYFKPLLLNLAGEKQAAEKEYRDAIKQLRGLSLAAPGQMDFYIFRIFCLRDLGEFDKALELCDYIVKAAENSGEVHTVRASVLTAMGRQAEADEEQKLARQHTALSDRIYDMIAKGEWNG